MKQTLLKSMAIGFAMCVGAVTASAQESWEAANDGKYMLYNVEQGLFFSRGASWGTRAFLDCGGMPVTIATNGEGASTFTMYDSKKTLGHETAENSIWCDKSNNSTWNIVKLANGNYTIQNATTGKYMTAAATDINVEDVASAASEWKLVKGSDVEALKEAYKTKQINAVLAKAGAAEVASEAELLSTAFPHQQISSGIAAYAGGDNYEPWSGSSNSIYSLAPALTFTAPAAGLYRIMIPAMYRVGSANVSAELATEGVDYGNVYLSVDGYKQPVISASTGIYAEDLGGGTPVTINGENGFIANSQSAVVAWNKKGYYENYVYVYAAEANEVKTIELIYAEGNKTGTKAKGTGNWAPLQPGAIVYKLISNAEYVGVESVAISGLKSTMNLGGTAQITATYTPANATICSQPVYASSNEEVLTVSADGLVTAVGLGTATITVTIEGKSTSMEVTSRQIQSGDDLTAMFAGADGTVMGGWTIDPANSEFKVNTWSNEGNSDRSNMKTPFIQNWLGKGNKLADSEMSNTVADLPAGYYAVTGRVRVYNEAGGAVDGASFFAGSTEVAITSANSIICNNGVFNTYGAVAHLDAAGDLKIGVRTKNATCNWVSFKDFNVSYWSTEGEAQAAILKAQAAEAIAAVDYPGTSYTGAGNAAFQLPQAKIDAIETAKKAAQAEGTQANIDALVAALNAWVTNDELNAPADGKVFSIAISGFGGYSLNEHPLEFQSNGTSGVTIPLTNHGVNKNRAQAFVFTPADGVKNGYTLSTTFADGTKRYVCTGAKANGNNTLQIRLTNDPAKALTVVVKPAGNGLFNLLNTENGNATLGCQDDQKDGGLYTTGSHNTFAITETAAAEVEVNIAAGKYATRIFPFKPNFAGTDVKVYSCAEVNASDELVLAEVPEPAANVPYILYSENGCTATLTGLGAAYEATYAAGLLTGAVSPAAEATVPTDSYVLQTQDDKQAFYVVTAEDPIELLAYRAYLTVPAAAAKAFTFPGGATAIESVETANGEAAACYNASGVKVSAPVKGLNIIKMSNGSVKKVYVK